MIRQIPIPPSSHIAYVAYDDEEMTLLIRFQRGGMYAYTKVTEDVIAGFAQALSAGQFFNESIRPNYEGKKISG